MTIEDYVKCCKKWEGGLSRDTADRASAHPCPTPFNGKTGWHTNKGITYPVWVSLNGKDKDHLFFEMPDENWWKIFKVLYFDRVKGDQFTSLNIACMVAAFAWGSGATPAGKILQRALNLLGENLSVDGVIGPKTIEAANSKNATELFDVLMNEREKFFRNIATKGQNAKFLKGWLNRLEDYKTKFRP